jgi:uncharacterized protein YidB (DUF937 family)
MDIMDSLKPVLGSKEEKQGDLISTIMNLIGGQGGLNGLINQFNSKGLGDVISSWISTGENKPVSPNQIENVLDNNTINSITSKLGIEKNDLMGQLSNLLPQVVDKLTPDGKVPEGNILDKGMDLLGGLFGKNKF